MTDSREMNEDVVVARAKGVSPKTLVLFAIIAALLIAAIASAGGANKAAVVDGVITKQIAQVDACTSSSFQLAVAEDANVEDAAESLFAALRTVAGVGMAKVHVAERRLEVSYCESACDEATLMAALAPTGLLAAE